MNRVSGENAPRGIVICPRCLRELRRRLEIRPPIRPSDLLRAPAAGMAKDSDPRAERIRVRKAHKRELRVALKRDGITGMVRLYLKTEAAARLLVDEDCPDCLALKRRSA